jgi:methyl-accepting chemotaxis protein
MKYLRIKNWSNLTKIMLLIVVALLPFIFIFYSYVVPVIEEKYYDDKRKALKSVVESAQSILKSYQQKVENGQLTLDDAKKQAMNEINTLRYSGKEYYFVYDMNGIVMALGSDPSKMGTNRYETVDQKGNKWVQNMISTVKSNGEGYVTYYYPKLGQTVALPKTSFVKIFEPWQCLIGSGVYTDDVEAEINKFEGSVLYPILIAIGFALFLAFLLGKFMSAPIKKLQAAAEIIASGDFSHQIESHSNDEVGKLTEAIKIMANKVIEKSFWYEEILDSIAFPVSVTDMDMNWTFINKAAEKLTNKKRNEVVGKHCSNWNIDICKTEKCGITCLKKGEHTSSFVQSRLGLEFQVDTSYLTNASGKQIGHIEILQDMTKIKTMEKYMGEQASKMLVVMEKFAEGDLTVSLPIEKDDDIGKLFAGFNKSVQNIGNLMVNVADVVEAVASASSQISSSSEEMAAGAQEQSSQTTEVAGAIEEMTKTILETTKNSSIAADAAKNAGSIAKEGGNDVSETIQGMNRIAAVVKKSAETVQELGKSSDQIGEIIQVIDDIADQTNLLALNAAIEAARAGEQGRGFAVVADEVRKLAERTTKATKEIASMIKQIQKDTVGAVQSMTEGTKEVERGKLLADKAGESLSQIIKGASDVVDVITQVAAASEEQSSTSEEISKSIEAINNVTRESTSGVQQVASAAEDLNRLTVKLQQLVASFKISEHQREHSEFDTQNGQKGNLAVRPNGVIVRS